MSTTGQVKAREELEDLFRRQWPSWTPETVSGYAGNLLRLPSRTRDQVAALLAPNGRPTALVLPDEPAEWPEAPELPGPPDPDPFPVDTLPPGLRLQVESVTRSMQVPPDLPALLALGAVSAAVAGKLDVVVRPGWVETPNLYVAVILSAAARKSPANQAMTGPVREWDAEEIRRQGPRHRAALDALQVAEKALERLKADAARGKEGVSLLEVENARNKLEALREEVPPDGRLLCGDVTPEALVVRMAGQGGRAAVMEPEPGPLHVLAGRYSDSTPRLEELKKAWGGEPIIVDRVGRPPLRIERPALTLALCLQPGVLGELQNSRAFRTEGALARFLWVQPPHGLGERLTGPDVPEPDPEAEREYGRTLRILLDAPAAPGPLRLSREAQEVVWRMEAIVELQLGDGGRLEPIRDWGGKMVGHAVRVAALLELASRAGDGRPLYGDPVGGWAMDAGTRIMWALATHALAVLEPSRSAGSALLAYILRRAQGLPAGSSLRDLWQATRGRAAIDSMEDLTPLVERLQERGCLRLVSPPREGPGRPPSPVIEIHPAIRGDIPTIPRTPPEVEWEPDNGDSGDGSRGPEKSEPMWEGLSDV